MYRELYVLVEGNDDERFIDRVVSPILESKYDYIGYYQYAQRSKREIERFIRSLLSKQADFLCLTDINASPCVTARKQYVQEHKIGKVTEDKIVVVKMEIESWYLAGLDEGCCGRMHIPICVTTDTINKEQFVQFLEGSNLGYTINCMIQMLNNYDVDTAKRKNKSFDYFHGKHLE